jgi:pimeloyl-ACP methyl ester carboxylesterase
MLLTGTLVAALAFAGVAPTEEVRVHTGVINGAPYRVEVPPDWNGTVLLYNHGFYSFGYTPAEVELTNQPQAKAPLLAEGYALAASQYANPHGYSVPDALRDQTALLDWFHDHVGTPRRVLTWGESGGGLTSVLLAEHDPHRIDGVLAMCGPVGGGGALFDQLLDLAFTVRTLLAPELEVVRLTDPIANEAKAAEVLRVAKSTPEGRARLALANAFASVPGWSRSLQPRSTDVAEQVGQQVKYDETIVLALAWGTKRADIEARAGGNPSGNVGVDYRDLLRRSGERDLARQAYRDAGLDLSTDLDRLAAAPRITADAHAVRWLTRYGSPTGRGTAPVVTLHPVGDVVATGHERAYAEKVDPSRLRQLYVDRGGHCTHTAAEELVALGVLVDRVETGRWPTTAPHRLNAAAGRYGPELRFLFDWTVNESGTAEPGFVRHHPAPLTR